MAPKNQTDAAEAGLAGVLAKQDEDVRILIVPGSWNFVGYYRVEGEHVVLYNAHCVRDWGTTKGLGELTGGPTKQTVLDPSGIFVTLEKGLPGSILCDAKAWQKALGPFKASV